MLNSVSDDLKAPCLATPLCRICSSNFVRVGLTTWLMSTAIVLAAYTKLIVYRGWIHIFLLFTSKDHLK